MVPGQALPEALVIRRVNVRCVGIPSLGLVHKAFLIKPRRFEQSGWSRVIGSRDTGVLVCFF
jgi:hypothetical protein